MILINANKEYKLGVRLMYMHLITQRDFETKAGQQKIVQTIHTLESKVHELEQVVHKLAQKEDMLEHELQGPEAF